MAAIGWYVQLVHYPAFLRIKPEEWGAFHAFHGSMTGVLVVGPMLAQTAATAWYFALAPLDRKSWILAACWLLSFGWTLAVTGPIHGRLAQGTLETEVPRLIASCWVRSLAWTAQALVAAWLLVRMVEPQVK
jgi:hypothetical protein